jgi:hypothetical protein
MRDHHMDRRPRDGRALPHLLVHLGGEGVTGLPSGWRPMAMTKAFLDNWEREFAPVPAPRAYEHRDGRSVLMGRESLGREPDADVRWHLSVRAAGRVPTWGELVDTAHALRPGVPMAVGIPPRSWWLNVHPNVLHMWELRDEALIAQWRSESMGMAPT